MKRSALKIEKLFEYCVEMRIDIQIVFCYNTVIKVEYVFEYMKSSPYIECVMERWWRTIP